MTLESNKFALVFASLPDPVFILDGGSRIEYSNAAAVKFLGKEEAGEGLGDLLPWLEEDLRRFASGCLSERTFEKELDTKLGGQFFQIILKRLGSGGGEFPGTAVIFKDLPGHLRGRVELYDMAHGLTGVVGDSFFVALLQNLVKALTADYALVCEFSDAAKTKTRTVSFSMDGEIAENFEYPLAGTPCEKVVTEGPQSYIGGVTRTFPHDNLAVELGVESYFGVPLVGSSGEVLGLIAILGRKVLKSGSFALSILEVFAPRAAAELERKQAENALRASEERYRSLVENVNLGIVLIGVDRRIVMANGAVGRMFHKPVGELVGRECFRELRKQEAVCPDCPWTSVRESGLPVTIESEGIRDDGSRFFVNLKTFPIHGPDGKPVGFIEIGEDITDKKMAEESVRVAKAQLETVVNGIPDIIGIKNPDLSMIRYNEAGYRYFKKSHEEVAGRKCYEIADREKPCNPCACTEAIRTKETTKIERYIEELERWLDIRAYPVFDQSGEVSHIIEHIRDVSSKKKAEEVLNSALESAEESRDKIDAILKSASDGLIVMDAQGKIVLMNPVAERMLDLRFGESSGMVFGSPVLDRGVSEKFRAASIRAKDGWTFDFEFPGPHPSSGKVFRAKTSIIRGKSGNRAGMIFLLQDVTHEREMDRLKTEFISTAAHELNTPLASIIGYSELLLSEMSFPAEERKEFLNIILEKGEALSTIVDELLDVSRIESGRGLDLKVEPCNISGLIRQTVKYFMAHNEGRRFEVEIPEKKVEVEIDKGKIVQVVENLLSNAVKYSPGGEPVLVSGELSRDEFSITISDRGIGIPSDQVENVFDKFYRVDQSNTGISGTGLGLTIVKHFVEAHGGLIRLESELGKGTAVKFSLPLERIETTGGGEFLTAASAC